ncbi:MAG: hypothetical protein HQL69_23690 [Magnetococcales bacterium]|nr:hypothetical protein [Magnetococcales bacterium]
MEQTTEAELELPIQEIATAFDISTQELEVAMMSGMVKVEQEAIPQQEDDKWPNSIKLTMTMGDKVVAMPVALHYPEKKENALG